MLTVIFLGLLAAAGVVIWVAHQWAEVKPEHLTPDVPTAFL
jgi:hypothetical protein